MVTRITRKQESCGTSALGPRVPPVVLLTLSAGLPSKAVTTLTLARELHTGGGEQA